MECSKLHTRNRQANDDSYREMQKRLGKEKTQRINATPELKEHVLARKRELYAQKMQDAQFVVTRRAKQRAYIARAESVRMRKKITHSVWCKLPAVLEKRRARDRLTYELKLKHDPVHIEKRKKRSSQWAKDNKDKANAKTALRRAARKRAVPKWLTAEHKQIMQLMYAVARRVSKETGIVYELDHIYPLAGETVCGLHCPENLQLLTRIQNRAKHNRITEVRS